MDSWHDIVDWAAWGAGIALLLASLLRHRPLGIPAFVVPGLILVVRPIGSLAAAWIGGDPELPPLLFHEARNAMVAVALGWLWMPALAAPVALLRPGEPTSPTPSRALVELAVACTAAVLATAWVGRPDVLLPATAPSLVVVLALRTSDRLRRARRDAATVQLAGAAWLTAAVAWQVGWDSLVREELYVQLELLAFPVPALALAAIGFAHAGLPSWRCLAEWTTPPAVFAAVVILAMAEHYTRPERELAALDPPPELAAAPAGAQPLAPTSCWTWPGQRCDGQPVWLAPPDQPLTRAVASAGPYGGHLATRTATGAYRGVPLHVPESAAAGLYSGVLVRRAPGGRIRVGDLSVPGLEAAAAEIRAARSACNRAAVMLAPGDDWTAAEVAALCGADGCVLDAAATASCFRYDGHWVVVCPAGVCRWPSGTSVLCERSGGCTLVLEDGGTGERSWVGCPGGGCTIRVHGPADVSCGGRCDVEGDPTQITCRSGDCRFR